MKHLLLVCLFALVCISLQAQTISIKDIETAQPISLATLTSAQPSANAVTDARGKAEISAFKGADQIEIRSAGFDVVTVSYQELVASQFVVELIPNSISLDHFVVSAARWNQPQRDVPSRIVTISPKDVALQNPQSAADLLSASGDVFIQKSQQGGGSPIIRGFATNRVLLSVDGVRMNTAIFRSGNLQNVISLDPFAIENTEVLFGPGSVIYGSDAIGGVMSFTTLTPTLTSGSDVVVSGKAAGRYSSANSEQTGHFDFNIGWKKWAMVTSFTSNDFGDLRMGRNGRPEYLRTQYVVRQDSIDRVVTNNDLLVQRPTGFKQMNMMQKVRFKPSDKWDLNYAFHYSNTSTYARYDRLLRLRNGLPRSAEWNYGPQEWMMNNLRIAYTSAKGIFDQATLNLAHQYFEESRIDRDLNKPTRFVRIDRVQAYSANLDLFKKIGPRQKIYYGLEGVFNDITSLGRDVDVNTGAQQIGPARYPQSTWLSYAAYLTYQLKPTSDFTVQGGLRYNQFELEAEFDNTFYPLPFTSASINKGALTGSIGGVYTPLENLSVSVNVSTGFRSPNVDDVGKIFDSEPGAVVVPNPNLKAEYATNFEIGIAKVIGEVLKLDATAYYTLLNNALVRRDFQLNGFDSIIYAGEMSKVQAMQNAASAFVYGVQTGVEAKLPSGFGFTGRFNYQFGEEELDDGSVAPLRHAAPWFSSAHFTYTVKRLKLDFYGIYSAEVSFKNLAPEERGKDYMYATDANGDPFSPFWYTLNLKAMVQATDHLSISGGIENITDLRYRPYSSGLVAPGRNFILSARVLF